MMAQRNSASSVDRSKCQASESRHSKVSHSTSQHVRTLDVYWYVLNVCIGSGSKWDSEALLFSAWRTNLLTVFSIPSGIFAINGSVAITLFLWVVGNFQNRSSSLIHSRLTSPRGSYISLWAVHCRGVWYGDAAFRRREKLPGTSLSKAQIPNHLCHCCTLRSVRR